MNKKILIGSILAVIFVLASFSSVASAQTTKNDSLPKLMNNLRQNSYVNWRDFFEILFAYVLGFFYWWSITHPPP